MKDLFDFRVKQICNFWLQKNVMVQLILCIHQNMPSISYVGLQNGSFCKRGQIPVFFKCSRFSSIFPILSHSPTPRPIFNLLRGRGNLPLAPRLIRNCPAYLDRSMKIWWRKSAFSYYCANIAKIKAHIMTQC